jgi:hypothetical protein
MRLFLTACVIGVFLAGPMVTLGQEGPLKEKLAKEEPAAKKEKKSDAMKEKASKKNGGAGPSKHFDALPDPCLKNATLPGCGKGVQ